MLRKVTLIVTLTVMLAACTGTHLKFTVEPDMPGVDPYTSPEAGILSSAWLSSDTLLIEGYIKTYCGGAAITGDYKITGNNLILTYNIEAPGPVTSCKGVFRIRYEISNLKQKDYSISMVRQK